MAARPIEVVARIRGGDIETTVPAFSILESGRGIRAKTREFELDGVGTAGSWLYGNYIRSRIEGVRGGDRATIMVYGPTGSGKTHTLFGSPSEKGMLQLAMEQLNGVQLRLSAVEVYNEQVYDLIASKPKLEIKGGQVRGCASFESYDASSIVQRIQLVQQLRATRSTACNQTSSRSHCFVFIDVPSVAGRLIFVDMAGSENSEQAGLSGDAKLQSAKINQGNAAMKRVVESTANGDAYVPYRDSKLTMLLQDSFREEKMLMILCLSPAASDIYKTVCTLEYGAKAKSTVREVPRVVIKSESARGWNHSLQEASSKKDAKISELRALLQKSEEQLQRMKKQEDDLRAERLRTVQAENLKFEKFLEQRLQNYIEQQLIAEQMLSNLIEQKKALAGYEPVPQHPTEELQHCDDDELDSSKQDLKFVGVAQAEQHLERADKEAFRNKTATEEQSLEASPARSMSSSSSSPEALGVRGCIKRGLGPPPRPVTPLKTSSSNTSSRECEVIAQWETAPGALVCTVKIDEHAFLQQLRELITPWLAGPKKRFQFLMLGDECLITDTSLESEVRVVSLPRACNGESRLAVLRPPLTRSLKRREPKLLPVEEQQEEKQHTRPANSKRVLTGKGSRKISLQEHATMACIDSLLAATK